ncbi:class I SAM-dependent methyltransferase [Dyella monticola]|uniref:Class I SAM-dependent methyltransferase n=1 Tax=Dyella monticola TaxID=1927958 RepID=A0A370X681_9GAMM|nr:class I SAM-dependent methyltransferase [Dyella monticola]RDS83878.1 class I SAM-dependent methyltransferase [Dyella monticola]
MSKPGLNNPASNKPAFEDGHFYSPIVSQREVAADKTRIWQKRARLPAIDLNPPLHRELLHHRFPALVDGFDYPTTGVDDSELNRFYEDNGQFENLDPRVLFCMMRMLRPKRIVEVGSGYSTLLMMDVNERFLGSEVHITSIEPYPRPFLPIAEVNGRIRLLRHRAQDVDMPIFDQLREGDILFIDSSHVSKTGSDVNHLFLDVLPRLHHGVYVHIHDIFLPWEYPEEWVIKEGRSWNEQYLLNAFLQFNKEFRVIFGACYASRQFPDAVKKLTGIRHPGGGSFWMRRRRPVGALAPTVRRVLADFRKQGYWRP